MGVFEFDKFAAGTNAIATTLADLSGCHRSTVTTLLNEWIYEGFLRQVDGELRILKAESLPK